MQAKSSAAVAALFAQDDENMECDVNEVFLGRRFLLELAPEAVAKYTEGLQEIWLNLEELAIAEENHNKILSSIGCVASTLSDRSVNGNHTKVVLVRNKVEETNFIEVRIAVVGNVDAGKSTLLGVLTHNVLDDGRGQARKKLFRHKHEFETGRTSSVGNDILGFDAKGKITNKPNFHGRLDWIDICRDSAKVITFIDLAGHEKYLKTTIFGMTGHMPDYSMLMVGSNAGIIGTTREHLSLALSLSIPVLIVVTKIDMYKLMKSPGCRKRPILVTCIEDVIDAAHNFYSGKVCPIFQVSNVKGTNLELLRTFLNVIPVSRPVFENKPAEFQIDDIYCVDGVGTVVSGTCLAGMISLNDNLLLGPDSLGKFLNVPIKSIHRKRMPVSTIKAGQTASFALRKLTKKDVRKGMFLLSALLSPVACFEFVVEILILHHPTTIAPNYQAMVHVGSVRQTATITKMNKEVLRTGDRDCITLRFIRHPEYLRIGTRMVFREGRTKAVGTIRSIIPHTAPSTQQRVHRTTYKPTTQAKTRMVNKQAQQ
uniref:Tr-type G domain-containing protein n=1 Tax=Ditylenchus dipsaci TaxID=166011 RepID=A0A915CZF1_9BILA